MLLRNKVRHETALIYIADCSKENTFIVYLESQKFN